MAKYRIVKLSNKKGEVWFKAQKTFDIFLFKDWMDLADKRGKVTYETVEMCQHLVDEDYKIWEDFNKEKKLSKWKYENIKYNPA